MNCQLYCYYILPNITSVSLTLKKSSPAPQDKKCGNNASVTDEIREPKPDKDGNPYPKRNQCYNTIAKTENYNKIFTKLILKKVILPRAGADVNVGGGDYQVFLMWGDFKGHLCPKVKSFFLYQDNLDVDISTGGLTPVDQPLEKVINNLFKAVFRDLYDQYMITLQFIPSSNPKLPNR